MGVGLIASARRRSGSASVFGALVRKSTGDQTAGSGGFTTLNWDTEVYDDGSWHDTSSNTSRLTVPSGVPLVRVSSNLVTTAAFVMQHIKNGSTFRGMGKADTLNSGNHYVNMVSAPIAVSASDYLQEQVIKEVTGTVTPTSDNQTWFSIEKLAAATKYALVYHSASQSLTANTDTILSFDSEVADTDGFHSTVSNTSRLTVPSGVSLVRVCANVCGGNVTGQMTATLLKNGSGVTGLPFRDIESNAEENLNLFSAPLEVTAGDYFELRVSCQTATSVPTGDNIWFAIEEVPSTYKRALVTKSGSQSFSANVADYVSWNTEIYDADAMHDNSTNNSRLTVPSGCTRARPIFGLFGSNTTGQTFASVQKNGADYYGQPAFDNDTLGSDFISGAGAWVNVTAGDYFEVLYLSENARDISPSGVTFFCLECQ